MQSATEILATLDAACDSYRFPMLDNGYLYLAATRLSLFRTMSDWAMVIEVFGFNPRAGTLDLAIATFASRLHARDPASDYVTEDAHRNYLRSHPHDDYRCFFPVEDGPWCDEELVAEAPALELKIRGRVLPLPARGDYERVGVVLASSERIHVFELGRYLAAVAREQALATTSEQRVSVLPEMERLLVLDEWHHPDLANDQWPSEVESFQQLAEILSTGDVSRYRPTASPNTHWKNWPDGGTL